MRSRNYYTYDAGDISHTFQNHFCKDFLFMYHEYIHIYGILMRNFSLSRLRRRIFDSRFCNLKFCNKITNICRRYICLSNYRASKDILLNLKITRTTFSTITFSNFCYFEILFKYFSGKLITVLVFNFEKECSVLLHRI